MNARPLLPILALTGCLGTMLLPTAARAQRGDDPLADPLPVADGASYAQVDLAPARHRRAAPAARWPGTRHRARRRHRRGSLQFAIHSARRRPRAHPCPGHHPAQLPERPAQRRAQFAQCRRRFHRRAADRRHGHDQPQQPAARHPGRGGGRAQQRHDRQRIRCHPQWAHPQDHRPRGCAEERPARRPRQCPVGHPAQGQRSHPDHARALHRSGQARGHAAPSALGQRHHRLQRQRQLRRADRTRRRTSIASPRSSTRSTARCPASR